MERRITKKKTISYFINLWLWIYSPNPEVVKLKRSPKNLECRKKRAIPRKFRGKRRIPQRGVKIRVQPTACRIM